MLKHNFVIFHGNCCDGISAAWICRQNLPADTDFYAASHGRPAPDVTGKDVLIVDFSYRRPELLSLASQANSVKLLDHHLTAARELSDLDFCEFDMDRSGCRMAWDYFHQDTPPPAFIAYAEEGDLYRFTLPNSKAVNAALRSYPFTFEAWDMLAKKDISELVAEGLAVLRFIDSCVRDLAKTAAEVSLFGYQVPFVNCPVGRLVSPLGKILSEGEAFSASWFALDEESFVVSLRSAEGAVDVGSLAREHGGGGHEHAAGVRLRFQDYPDLFPWLAPNKPS